MDRVFTLGYEGIDIDSYIATLVKHRIGVVLDVRETPWSHKRNFSKSLLKRSLLMRKIYYVHVKAVGNPAIIRKTSSTVEECLHRFRSHLLANASALEELVFYINIAREMNLAVCLTCFERLPQNCHRSVVTEILAQSGFSTSPVHLTPEGALKTKKGFVPFSGTRVQQL